MTVKMQMQCTGFPSLSTQNICYAKCSGAPYTGGEWLFCKRVWECPQELLWKATVRSKENCTPPNSGACSPLAKEPSPDCWQRANGSLWCLLGHQSACWPPASLSSSSQLPPYSTPLSPASHSSYNCNFRYAPGNSIDIRRWALTQIMTN